MSENTKTDDQLSRRSMLKRGAVAGTAAIWVPPVVQVIDMSVAGAEGPSVVVPPPPPDTCQDISNIQIVVSKDGVYYGLKYDPNDSSGDRFTAWSEAAPESNDCIYYFEQSNPGTTVIANSDVADLFNDLDDNASSSDGDGSALVDVVSDCEWRLLLPLPGGYQYVAGYLKFGDVAPGSTDNKDNCPVAVATDGYIRFSTL